MASRSLKLRRDDVCVRCSTDLSAGTVAWWDAASRTVTCRACHVAESAVVGALDESAARELDRGRPGASAAREYERRRRNREARVRDAHPRIGGLLLAVREPPQHETSFHRGALGEQAVGASLERRTADGPAIILHDRRMPAGHGNIDHLAVAPAGVFVIDAKDHHGKIRVATPLFGRPRLLIAGRDRTKLVDGLDRQVTAVRAALADKSHDGVPVQGVFCFTQGDLPLLGAPRIRGHLLLYRKSLAKRLNADGALAASAIEPLARLLATAFPQA